MTVQPPVRPADPLLRLRGSENFSWKMFESFAEQFILAFTGKQPIHFGKHGEKQDGIDAYVDLDDETRWTFQFRQVENFDEADAKKLVAGTTFESQRHFVFAACEVGTAVRRHFHSLLDWEIWDVRDISMYVRTMPAEVGRRLVYQFFGSAWVNNFFDGSVIASLVSAELYFAPHGHSDLLRHDLAITGRETQVDELRKFVASDLLIALISGRGGIGKSRVLRELPSLRAEFEVRFVTALGLTAEAVADLPLQPTIIVIDDGHQRDDLATALEIVRQRPIKTKLVIAVRPHAGDSIRALISQSGFNREDIREITPLEELTQEQTKSLIRQVIGSNHDEVVAALTHRVSDSPILAVVASRLLKTKGMNLPALASDDDIRFAVFNRYRDEILGRIAKVDRNLATELITLIAALGPFAIEEPRTRACASAFLKVHEDELVRAVDDLEAAGILRRRGSGVRVTPEVLADFILEGACVTKGGKATGYAVRVFQHFHGVAGARLLKNLAAVDWRTKKKSIGVSLLEPVWKSILAEFREAGLMRRKEILAMVEVAAVFQPDNALEIVEYAMEKPVDHMEEIESHLKMDRSVVLEQLPEIVRAIAYHPSHVDRAARLLWELGRDDPRRVNSHPNHAFRILCELAGPRRRAPVRHRLSVVEAVSRLLRDPDVHDHHHSILEVMEAALAKQSMDAWSENAGSIQMQTYLVNRQAAAGVHAIATKVVFECARHIREDVLYRAAKVLIEQARSMYSGMLGQVVTEEQQATWKEDRLNALRELERIVADIKEPLIALEILTAVESLRHYDGDNEIKSAANVIIEKAGARADIAKVEILADSWGHRDRFNRRGRQIDLKLAQTQHQKRLGEAASQFVSEYTPAAFIAFFDETALRAREIGIKFSPELLLQEVARRDSRYGVDLVNRLLDVASGPFVDYLRTLLISLPVDEGLLLAKKALNCNRPEFARATAALLSTNATWSSSQLELYQTLIGHSESSVRAAALESAQWGSKSNLDAILKSLERLDIAGDSSIAHQLAEIFNEHNIPVIAIPGPLLVSLLGKLVEVPEINDYYLEEFVSDAFLIVPEAAVDMFLARIERRALHEDSHASAVPYEFTVDVDRLSAHPDYAAVLRKIRDASWQPSVWASHYVPQLWCAVADVRNAATRSVLNDWFQSGHAEKIEAAGNLLSGVDENFVFDHFDYVVEILDAASSAGKECYEQVASHLFMPGITSRQGEHGKPFPQDIELKRKAGLAMERLTPRTPAWRFYENLHKHALWNIERKRVRDEDYEEEFLD